MARVFRLLWILAALATMACSSQPPSPVCPDGGFCAVVSPNVPPTAGYTCVLPCECNLDISDCSDPNVCPSALCPDAGSERFCPQGWVCMPARPCEVDCTCAIPATYACVPPSPG